MLCIFSSVHGTISQSVGPSVGPSCSAKSHHEDIKFRVLTPHTTDAVMYMTLLRVRFRVGVGLKVRAGFRVGVRG